MCASVMLAYNTRERTSTRKKFKFGREDGAILGAFASRINLDGKIMPAKKTTEKKSDEKSDAPVPEKLAESKKRGPDSGTADAPGQAELGARFWE